MEDIPAVTSTLARTGMNDNLASILGRSLVSGASSSAISAADQMVRGAPAPDIQRNAAISGGIGLVLPGVGAMIGRGISAAGQKGGEVIGNLTSTERAAQRIVSGAASQDARMGQALTAVDEANAVLNGQPLLNVDRFGGNVRTLARTAKNMAPDAGAMLDEATQQRFLTQGDRAGQFIRRITGGNVNDLALQDQIQQAARLSNDAAYGRAYADPGASAIWTPEIRQLMQSPDVLAAIRGADRTAANDAALTGKPAVRNPFTFTTKPDGSVSVGLRTNPDGSRALPNLQFWDIVQRNLRRAAEVADRTQNGKADASTLRQLRRQLLNNLDQAVPSFGAARAGAAAAFGAEDALDAGRKFVTQQMAIPEAKAAYAQFSPAERKAFATGFASSLIDKISAARDNVNVINQVFGSPAARSQVELALGKSAASQLEQFVRIENIMQMTKQAVQGNSSTAKQLIAAGVVGGGLGGYFGNWDPRNMATGAGLMMAGRAGMRALGKSVDQKIMQRVADILASGDPDAINKEILNAALSGQHSDAIKAIERGIQIAGESALLQATRPQALN
jgi:hypothetical protein